MAEAVFVDANAFIALIISRDRYHQQARQYWQGLSPKPLRLTTGLVISEAYTLVRRWSGYAVARGFLEQVRRAQAEGFLGMVWPSTDWEDEIAHLLDAYPDQTITYVDAASLVACRRNPAIRQVFSFDHHLGLTGLTLVPGPVRRKRG